MRFVTRRDLQSRFAQLRRQLAGGQDLVVTSRGKPVALLTRIPEDNPEQFFAFLAQARAATPPPVIGTKNLGQRRERRKRG